MDIGKSFSYVFEDQEWITKVLIGGLIFLIPIIGQIIVIGYSIKVAQNVAQGNPRPLPSWNEFGDHLMRGLYGFLIQLVYSIPIILFYCVVWSITVAGAAATAEPDGTGGAGGLVGICLFPLIFVVALACVLAAYVALARFVATNNMSEAFKFGEVIATLRSNLSQWGMLLLVILLAGLVGGVGVIACGVGVLFTGFYSYCVIGHALGQMVARQSGSIGYNPPPSYGPPPTIQ